MRFSVVRVAPKSYSPVLMKLPSVFTVYSNFHVVPKDKSAKDNNNRIGSAQVFDSRRIVGIMNNITVSTNRSFSVCIIHLRCSIPVDLRKLNDADIRQASSGYAPKVDDLSPVWTHFNWTDLTLRQ